MTTPELLTRITWNPDLHGGRPFLRGTMVTVDYVLGMVAAEGNCKLLFKTYPTLTLEDVRACLEYARRIVDGEHRGTPDAIELARSQLPVTNWLVLTNGPYNPCIYRYRARNLDEAKERYALDEIMAERGPDGLWRYQREMFSSIDHLLARYTSAMLSLEIRQEYSFEKIGEIFCGIDWGDVIINFDKCYMQPRKRVGSFFMWIDDAKSYYVLYPTPRRAARLLAYQFEHSPYLHPKKLR